MTRPDFAELFAAVFTFPYIMAGIETADRLRVNIILGDFDFFFSAAFLNRWLPVRRWGGGVRGWPRWGFRGFVPLRLLDGSSMFFRVSA